MTDTIKITAVLKKIFLFISAVFLWDTNIDPKVIKRRD